MHKPDVPLRMLLKAAAFMAAAPVILLAIYMVVGYMDFTHGAYAIMLVFFAAAVMVRPYVASILTLTDYVDNLSQDRKVEAPNFYRLRSFRALSFAVNKLHRSWERRKQQMENIIDEREILVDSIPDVLIMIDNNFNIVRTNAAARKYFGQNLAYRKLKDVVQNDLLLRAVREAYEQGIDKDVEFLLLQPIEGYFRARVDHFPTRSTGGIAVIITMHNITELKRSEQMRADFVANASHEIRTPLASIIGFIETLQGPAKDDTAAREQFLQIMGEQAQRMSALVNDLLSLSKIEMNANSTPNGSVDMLGVIYKVRAHLDWASKEKRMPIEIEVPESLPHVRGDESELMQVLQNLVSNALKYGRVETPVLITAEVTQRYPADRSLEMDPPVLKIAVHDQGEGIPTEHIPRLTERFYRVSSTARKTSGTGLGLAIVKHILHRHKALLDVKSIVGVGSCFSIYVPIQKRELLKEPSKSDTTQESA